MAAVAGGVKTGRSIWRIVTKLSSRKDFALGRRAAPHRPPGGRIWNIIHELKAHMDTASDMQVLVRVVERGSFSAAAMDLRVTPSAVSKLISRLEDRLGVRLLHRTTRRLALTPEGETFYLRSRDILGAIEDAETEVSSAGRTPRGRLRINCGTALRCTSWRRRCPTSLRSIRRWRSTGRRRSRRRSAGRECGCRRAHRRGDLRR
jgi:DNA-binding MarR family transcriptional regulator